MKSLRLQLISIAICLSFFTPFSNAQQLSDENYKVPTFEPKYRGGNTPTVYIDEAHFNFHTLSGRYKPFAKTLRKDGYRVAPFKEKFSKETLDNVQILVIANAFGAGSNWTLPTKSAFTNEEIRSLNRWVKAGGSLFLIADHMPAPGAVAKLALSFDFVMINGYLYNAGTFDDIDIFGKKDGSLTVDALTEGIKSVATFTGQAFIPAKTATSLLNVGRNYMIYLPSELGKVHGSKTPKFYAKGLSQGAYSKFGKGKLAVFGEAGMFTAQIADKTKKMGMNNPKAKQNHRLLLNIVHWLDSDAPISAK